MLRSLQPGPIEHQWQGSVWCSGWVQRLNGRSVAEAKKLAAVWQKMLEQHGRTIIDEPEVFDRGSYVLVKVRFEPYNTGKAVYATGKPVATHERGNRGGEQAAERRASWMTRLTGSLPSLATQPV